MAKKYTKSEIEGMIKNLKEKEKKARSKWGKAVLQDAQWLLEKVLEWMQVEKKNEVEITEKYLLNGAKDWGHFSVGGNALVYEGEIAEHYLTPSDLKSVGYDEANCSVNERPSERETWYELQARALRQAWWAIRDEMNGTTEFSMSLCEFEEKKGKSNFDMEKDEYWGLLIEYGIATEDELQLITSINGYSEETLNDVLYARTGYRSWEQYCEADDIENEEDDDENFSIKKGTKKQYEEYLNEIGEGLSEEEFIIGGKMRNGKYGTMLKKYDPIAFNVGYNEWKQNQFSIIDDTKDVLRATGKLAGNIVKNTTDKGGLLMF